MRRERPLTGFGTGNIGIGIGIELKSCGSTSYVITKVEKEVVRPLCTRQPGGYRGE